MNDITIKGSTVEKIMKILMRECQGPRHAMATLAVALQEVEEHSARAKGSKPFSNEEIGATVVEVLNAAEKETLQ